MSTVENIDTILNVPYGELSKKEIEYCLNIISMKNHEVIYNTSTKLYLKMAKHALATKLWNLCSKCCRCIVYMINNYKVDKSIECELYLIYGYLISRTPYVQIEKIKKNKVSVIYMNKLKNDAAALKNAMIGFRMAVQLKDKDLIINFTVFTCNLMESWLNISREFSYTFYFILKTFDDVITEIDHNNKKWVMYIKYEVTKCLMDIKKYNYGFQKIQLKNAGKNNMDIEFNPDDTTIFPENSYLKKILLNIDEDLRVFFYLFINNSLNCLPPDNNITLLIEKNITDIADLAKNYDQESFLDFIGLYVRFVLANLKKPETTKHINDIINKFKINENEKIYISIIKCFKKLPLTIEKIDKLYNKILNYYDSIVDIEEESHTVSFDSYKSTPQNYFLDLAYLALLSKHYNKARSILSNVKFFGYTSRTLILKKKLFEIYLDMDEYLSNPTLLLLSTESIDFQLNKMKKMKELITLYEKQDGDKNFIQKAIQSMWNYMFPLLQQRLYPKIKPYIEFLYKILERTESPLFILRSVIGKELAKICEYDLEYTRAFKYLKKAYLIVNDYNGLLKSNTYHLLNLKLSAQTKDITVEEKLYLKIEEIRKSHNSIPNNELENTLKIYLYDFTNVKRDMEVEEIISKDYIPEQYGMRYIKEFNTINRCKTTMMTLLKIIDLAFQRKIYSIAFDGASIIIFNTWDDEFSKTEYFKISMAHVSYIRAYIVLLYWKLYKNNKEQKRMKYINDKSSDSTLKNLMIRQQSELEMLTRNNSKQLATPESKMDEDDKNSTKFYDYYESRRNSLPYKEKLMEDVLRSINIGLEIDKQWIIHNSASIIYDFVLIQSKTIVNGYKDYLFMGYFDEIKILYEKLKQSTEKLTPLYIYICSIYMQANVETIEYELYGEIKLTNTQRQLLENKNNQSKNLNNYCTVVKEIYNFFTTSNLKLDNYTSMTISNLWIRYKQIKPDEETTVKDVEKTSLFPVDSLENKTVTSTSDYVKNLTEIMEDYISMEEKLSLSNWVESLVRIGRCALREKLYYYALKCFNSAFKENIPTDTKSSAYDNEYDANICFYWTSIGYFECANVYQEYIAINHIITNIPTMHLNSINYLVESTKYLRLQSNVSYELFLEISKRAWNIAIQLLKYKNTYSQLEKSLYDLVFVTCRITTEHKSFKEYFKDPKNEVVTIFSQIFSLLLELNLLNKNWTSGLHIISKLNALLPKNVDNNCYLEKLQFFYHTNNEMGLNSLFINKPELQLFYWTNIACMEESEKEQKEHAYKTCLDLCEESDKKAEYIIKYVDWMNTNKVEKEKCLDYLIMAWDLIDPTISEKVKENNDEREGKELYIDENKSYSVYHVEILVRSFILYLTIHHTKENTLACIQTIYKLLMDIISNTYKTAILHKGSTENNNRSHSRANKDENKKNTKDKKKEKGGKEKKGENKNKINKSDQKSESNNDIELEKVPSIDSFNLSTIPELPENIKDWLYYAWPNVMFSVLEEEEEDNNSILIRKNIRSIRSLIRAIYYTIEECLTLLRYNYVYFFLWLINVLINNFISSDEKNEINCVNNALDFHIYNILDEKGISFNRYFALIKQFSMIKTDINVLSIERKYSIDKLDIFNDFLFDNTSDFIKLIEIFVLNKDIVDVNKMKPTIKQIEEGTSIHNETVMSELIYSKLVIYEHLNLPDFTEEQYIDLCKIGLKLNCNIKMKYRIANCYLRYLSEHSYTFEKFEKAGQFTLSLLKEMSSPEDWIIHSLIGKLHQDIGSILGNYALKCDDKDKIFKLAYIHFNEALKIFDSNHLYYNKAFLIVDYIKVIYCHLFYNKIWSKNLLLICLSLIKESQQALDFYKNDPKYVEITETSEYKNCVELITILEIELYIIINKYDNNILYQPKDSIKHMISNYINDSYILPGINEKYAFIKQISMEEAKNTCLGLKEYMNKSNSKNIHILFLYGIVQCLYPDSEDQLSVVDLNNIFFKKTLKIGDYYNKEQKNTTLIKNKNSFLDLNFFDEEEQFYTEFFSSWDLVLLNNITAKYEHSKLENSQLIEGEEKGEEERTKDDEKDEENDDEKDNEKDNEKDDEKIDEKDNDKVDDKDNDKVDEKVDENNDENDDNEKDKEKNDNVKEDENNDEKDDEEITKNQLNKKESTGNILSPTSSPKKIPSANEKSSPTFQSVPINNDISTSMSMIECFNDVISIGLASIDYQYVQLCSEYLYKLTNEDLSLKFGYLSLLQNCVYSNIYKNILLKTTNPIYSYSYIINLLKEHNSQSNENYIKNNITQGWKRYVISKDYLTSFKDIPKGIDILILQHSLDKKKLYTGLINKDDSQAKGKDGGFQYDFLEYDVNYEEWITLIAKFNNIIEEYEIDSSLLDYIIKKEYKSKKEEENMELLRQEEAQNTNNEEQKKEKKKNKKTTNINREKSKTKSNLTINQNDAEMEKANEKANEMKIKENIPDDVLSLFQEYIRKIINYLSPIFDHYKKVNNKNTANDKKKKKEKDSNSEINLKTKYNLIICCDETFLILPLGLIFNLYSSWGIIYKEFSYNMFLNRYQNQFSSDKESQQTQEFAEVNYLNCMVNFDMDSYAKKDKKNKESEKIDIQIEKLDELKNILSTNNILNKWPGSYFTKIQTAQLEHYFSPPGFLYIGYKHLFDDIPLNKFNFNLSRTNHAILFENISISKFKIKDYKLGIKETIQTMMLLSLYGINNVYYQPYLVDFSTNEILLDTIFKCHGVPLNEVLINLSYESKVPISCCECFGLPTSLRIKTEKKENSKEK